MEQNAIRERGHLGTLGELVTSPAVVRLADCYRAERASIAGGDGGDPPDLEPRLARLFELGRARHPTIAIDAGTFAAHLARCRAPLAEAGEVHAADLFLACAALQGDRVAIATLHEDCWPIACGYLRSFATSDAALDEIGQELWSALLFGAGAGSPKLESYSGKGPLAAFVGITGQRIAVMRYRREEAQARAATRAAVEVSAIGDHAELMFAKHEYREAFQRALSDALAQLDDRIRMILRMHVVDGLSLDRIAKVYRVSQSTISRWLAAARKQALARAQQLLFERLALAGGDVDSLWNLVVSQVDLHISSVLGGHPRGGAPSRTGD